MQEVHIVGEAVSLVETHVVRTVALSDWLETLAARNPIQSGILPRGTRLFSRKDGQTIVVVEQEPAVRRVEWNLDKTEGNFWRLAFPYVEFVFTLVENGAIVQTEVFYRNSPIRSMDDELCWPNLGNIYSNNCRICTDGMEMDGNLALPLATRLENFITAFWASRFNGDLLWAFDFYRRKDQRLANLTAWQDATRENPLFPLEIPWQPYVAVRNLQC